jgi:DNA-binding MarR family transcriptional regulator
MTGKGEDLYEVLRHVRPLHQYAAKAVADALRDTQLTMPMRAVLERLYNAGPQTVPQVGRSLWLSRQFVQRTVDRAAALGFVELADNPAHRRSRLVGLTHEGRAAFEQIRADENRVLDAIAADLTTADVAACVRVLGRLTDALGEAARASDDDAGWSVPGPRPGEEVR